MVKQRIKFRSINEDPFYKELNKRVNNYFSSNQISKKGNWKVYFKALIMIAYVLVPYFLFLTNRFNNIHAIPLIVIMGFALAGISFNVQHEGGHGNFSNKNWINKLMGGTMYIIGGNAENWNFAHNQLHHSYANIFGHDNDLNGRGMLRFSPEDKKLKIHKYQHIYFFIFYGLLSVNWMFYTDFRQMKIFNKMRQEQKQSFSPVFNWLKLIFFKIVMFTFWVIVPLLFLELSFGQFLLGFLAINFISGSVLSFVILSAHIVDEAQMPVPDLDGNMQHSWAVHQLLTTTNWATSNRLINWYTGGLNHQVEHHLFPTISYIHFTGISPIIKSTCKEFGYVYLESPTFTGAIASHYRHLKKMGL